MTTASQEATQDEGRREEAPLETLTAEERLFRMRHSAAHVLAEAVLEMFPEAKYAIGPPIALFARDRNPECIRHLPHQPECCGH